jgi:hypothetical protein
MKTYNTHCKRFCRYVGRLFLAGSLCLFTSTSLATTNEVIGSYSNWPTTWHPLNTLNDTNDGISAQLDFVGSTTNPAAFYVSTNGYVFFRQRMQAGTAPAFSGANFVLINLIGTNYGMSAGADDGKPDYGFAWDSKSNNNNTHGLEMQVRSSIGATWATTSMTDIDGSIGSKGINDINGNSRTTDGYLRTIDQQSTTNFGVTTFIDFAVSWSYLQTYTGLKSNQSWRVAFGSLANATDHGAIDGDIAGMVNPTDPITNGWVTFSSTPTSSGIDLRAYQGAGGVYVEFAAYDVRKDGEITLYLLGANGETLWEGTTNVLAGAQYVSRFIVPGLTVGGTYSFKVKDEVGKEWSAPSVTVGTFAMKTVSMSLTGMTLSFSSQPRQRYEIQWTDQLGGTWQPLTNVMAVGESTSVPVTYPNPAAPAGFFRIRMQ